ncbi:DUF6351 family protein [Variovorax sp. ZS18.2.2]|uniref:DUF6351 family protein n=1 Tax=Variovorax sp. ZS18.2.2 TaxID=2971255 RepID=UPI0021516EDB|nr:DUF6351 family protein [Variovorax sp. ZS18.2.2]MCR6480512.1 DUF6351 family protein [Variovorax sp. ZS18.2.2]
MKHEKTLVRSLAVGVLCAAAVVACGGGGGSEFRFFPSGAGGGGGDGSGDSPVAAIALKTLSNRADLISDGDALMEVVLPQGVKSEDVRVDVNGTDVSPQFAVRDNGRMIGLVAGLHAGENQVSAKPSANATNVRGARLVVTNYSRSGNIFAGAPIQPWVCATKTGSAVTVSVPGTGLSASTTPRPNGLDSDPVDADCNAPTTFSYYFMPKAKEGSACTFTVAVTVPGTTPCFQPYDPKSRPADAQIADVTTDRGDTVKALLRLERGVLDRGIYQVVGLFDPAKPWTPVAPQKGWNGKVLWSFAGAATGNRFQQQPLSDPFNDRALRAGFITVTSALTDHQLNNNDLLATEAMMMIKEHIVDTYGEIRYAMGFGASGGSTMQTVPTSIMPGLLDGLITLVSFPDTVTIWGETRDCMALEKFYASANAGGWSEDARSTINGHPSSAYCKSWVTAYETGQDPTLPVNCGGLPASIVYDPVLRPDGVRCSLHDALAPLVGTVKDVDGIQKTRLHFDNVGVQYGLKALQGGKITVEQFVALNEGVGSLDLDSQWTGGVPASPKLPAPRFKASEDAISALYRSGMVQNAKNLAGFPILDIRVDAGGGNFHMAWRSLSQRARLDAANGGHANHVMWAAGVLAPEFAQGRLKNKDGFATMDQWLGAIEADKTADPKAQKVIRNKPSAAEDTCYAMGSSPADLKEVPFDSGACFLNAKPFESPRMASGEPLTGDVLKCRLKPLAFASADYTGKAFTSGQQARMQAVFPEGVCDWNQPSAGQVPWTPTTFKAGPGGTALGAAPVSQPL